MGSSNAPEVFVSNFALDTMIAYPNKIFGWLIHLRVAEVGDDGGLIEGDSICSNGESGPNQCKEPQSDVFQCVDDFTELEVLFVGTRSVGRKPSLYESLLFFRQPFCCLGDCFGGSALAADCNQRGGQDSAYNLEVETR